MLIVANFSAIIPMVFDAMRTGMTFCSLKMARFLASHNCQHRFFGMVAQRRLRIGFLVKDPGNRLAQSLKSWAALSGRSRLKSLGRTIFQTDMETLHWRNRWLEVSSAELHKAQRDGPRMPLFIKFSAVKSLLCRRSQMKLLTLGMLSRCQTFFHI